jgi:hypothetical protein
MKKQLLIAAVAATMTSAAFADVSITGDAKFEYFNTDTAGVVTNTANTEVNLGIAGKNGDTSVVMNLEFNTHGDNTMDVEDMYITSKIGDVSIKAGNYTTGTSAILGEIDNGTRASNKVTLSTTVNGVKIYAGNVAAVGEGASAIDANMFAGVSAKVAGFTVQAKHNSPTVDSFGIAGDVAGFGVRLETKNSSEASKDVTFGSISKDVNGVALNYSWIDADANGLIGEDDSDIFAVENDSLGDSNSQVSAKTSMAGNTVTVKAGTVGYAATADLDYTQIAVSRSLASGATLALTYTNKDTSAAAETKTFEADLSVKF